MAAVLSFAQNPRDDTPQANAVLAQPTPVSAKPGTAGSPDKWPGPAAAISYVDGQLTIQAHEVVSGELLAKVAALTGANIDIPSGAATQSLDAVDLGPGPAREILTALLNDSDFDYLIMSSDTDQQKVKAVLLMRREKKGKPNEIEVAARSGRNFGRMPETTPRWEERQPSDAPASAPSGDTTVASAVTTEPPQPQPDPPAVPAIAQQESPVQGGDPMGAPANGRPGAMNPPSSLNPQSISQQLQQMYQQRAQMIQQQRQSLQPPSPPNGPGR